MKTDETAYYDGFTEKCAELGIDSDTLLKEAKIPMRLLSKARKLPGVRRAMPKLDLLTGRSVGRARRQAVGGFRAKMKAGRGVQQAARSGQSAAKMTGLQAGAARANSAHVASKAKLQGLSSERDALMQYLKGEGMVNAGVTAGGAAAGGALAYDLNKQDPGSGGAA
jgi:hypothetical protein